MASFSREGVAWADPYLLAVSDPKRHGGYGAEPGSPFGASSNHSDDHHSGRHSGGGGDDEEDKRFSPMLRSRRMRGVAVMDSLGDTMGTAPLDCDDPDQRRIYEKFTKMNNKRKVNSVDHHVTEMEAVSCPMDLHGAPFSHFATANETLVGITPKTGQIHFFDQLDVIPMFSLKLYGVAGVKDSGSVAAGLQNALTNSVGKAGHAAADFLLGNLGLSGGVGGSELEDAPTAVDPRDGVYKLMLDPLGRHCVVVFNSGVSILYHIRRTVVAHAPLPSETAPKKGAPPPTPDQGKPVRQNFTISQTASGFTNFITESIAWDSSNTSENITDTIIIGSRSGAMLCSAKASIMGLSDVRRLYQFPAPYNTQGPIHSVAQYQSPEGGGGAGAAHTVVLVAQGHRLFYFSSGANHRMGGAAGSRSGARTLASEIHQDGIGASAATALHGSRAGGGDRVATTVLGAVFEAFDGVDRLSNFITLPTLPTAPADYHSFYANVSSSSSTLTSSSGPGRGGGIDHPSNKSGSNKSAGSGGIGGAPEVSPLDLPISSRVSILAPKAVLSHQRLESLREAHPKQTEALEAAGLLKPQRTFSAVSNSSATQQQQHQSDRYRAVKHMVPVCFTWHFGRYLVTGVVSPGVPTYPGCGSDKKKQRQRRGDADAVLEADKYGTDVQLGLSGIIATIDVNEKPPVEDEHGASYAANTNQQSNTAIDSESSKSTSKQEPGNVISVVNALDLALLLGAYEANETSRAAEQASSGTSNLMGGSSMYNSGNGGSGVGGGSSSLTSRASMSGSSSLSSGGYISTPVTFSPSNFYFIDRVTSVNSTYFHALVGTSRKEYVMAVCPFIHWDLAHALPKLLRPTAALVANHSNTLHVLTAQPNVTNSRRVPRLAPSTITLPPFGGASHEGTAPAAASPATGRTVAVSDVLANKKQLSTSVTNLLMSVNAASSMKTAMTTASGRGYTLGRGVGGGGEPPSGADGAGRGEKTMVTIVTVFQLIPTLTALSLAPQQQAATHKNPGMMGLPSANDPSTTSGTSSYFSVGQAAFGGSSGVGRGGGSSSTLVDPFSDPPTVASMIACDVKGRMVTELTLLGKSQQVQVAAMAEASLQAINSGSNTSSTSPSTNNANKQSPQQSSGSTTTFMQLLQTAQQRLAALPAAQQSAAISSLSPIDASIGTLFLSNITMRSLTAVGGGSGKADGGSAVGAGRAGGGGHTSTSDSLLPSSTSFCGYGSGLVSVESCHLFEFYLCRQGGKSVIKITIPQHRRHFANLMIEAASPVDGIRRLGMLKNPSSSSCWARSQSGEVRKGDAASLSSIKQATQAVSGETLFQCAMMLVTTPTSVVKVDPFTRSIYLLSLVRAYKEHLEGSTEGVDGNAKKQQQHRASSSPQGESSPLGGLPSNVAAVAEMDEYTDAEDDEVRFGTSNAYQDHDANTTSANKSLNNQSQSHIKTSEYGLAVLLAKATRICKAALLKNPVFMNIRYKYAEYLSSLKTGSTSAVDSMPVHQNLQAAAEFGLSTCLSSPHHIQSLTQGETPSEAASAGNACSFASLNASPHGFNTAILRIAGSAAMSGSKLLPPLLVALREVISELSLTPCERSLRTLARRKELEGAAGKGGGQAATGPQGIDVDDLDEEERRWFGVDDGDDSNDYKNDFDGAEPKKKLPSQYYTTPEVHCLVTWASELLTISCAREERRRLLCYRSLVAQLDATKSTIVTPRQASNLVEASGIAATYEDAYYHRKSGQGCADTTLRTFITKHRHRLVWNSLKGHLFGLGAEGPIVASGIILGRFSEVLEYYIIHRRYFEAVCVLIEFCGNDPHLYESCWVRFSYELTRHFPVRLIQEGWMKKGHALRLDAVKLIPAILKYNHKNNDPRRFAEGKASVLVSDIESLRLQKVVDNELSVHQSRDRKRHTPSYRPYGWVAPEMVAALAKVTASTLPGLLADEYDDDINPFSTQVHRTHSALTHTDDSDNDDKPFADDAGSENSDTSAFSSIGGDETAMLDDHAQHCSIAVTTVATVAAANLPFSSSIYYNSAAPTATHGGALNAASGRTMSRRRSSATTDVWDATRTNTGITKSSGDNGPSRHGNNSHAHQPWPSLSPIERVSLKHRVRTHMGVIFLKHSLREENIRLRKKEQRLRTALQERSRSSQRATRFGSVGPTHDHGVSGGSGLPSSLYSHRMSKLSLHNLLLVFLASPNGGTDQELVAFIESSTVLDKSYALRVCMEHERYAGVVQVYFDMGFLKDAVEQSLSMGDFELAKHMIKKIHRGTKGIQRGDTGYATRHDLWQLVIKYVSERHDGAKAALNLIDESGGDVNVSHVLPYLGKEVSIFEFKDELLSNVNRFGTLMGHVHSEIASSKQEMEQLKEELRYECAQSQTVDLSRKCAGCSQPVLSRRCVVFRGCGHAFHLACLHQGTKNVGFAKDVLRTSHSEYADGHMQPPAEFVLDEEERQLVLHSNGLRGNTYMTPTGTVAATSGRSIADSIEGGAVSFGNSKRKRALSAFYGQGRSDEEPSATCYLCDHQSVDSLLLSPLGMTVFHTAPAGGGGVGAGDDGPALTLLDTVDLSL